MRRLTLALVLIFILLLFPCSAQIYLDSCGLDKCSTLNTYELAYIDSILFQPIKLKNGQEIDHINGFDFNNKKLAFFSCSHDENSDGFLTKDKFFDFVKPDGYRGPRSLEVLTDLEKQESGGFDAILVINCKGIINSTAYLLDRLIARRRTNNLLPGQK